MQIRDYMQKISKYRAHIMGFCILDVLIGHSGMIFRSGPISYLTSLLWVIDIFFFMTGLGAYYSLNKNPEVLPFYKRRFMRVYPYYLPAAIIYFIPLFVLYTNADTLFMRIQELLGSVFLVGWVSANLDNQFNWYIHALMVFYLASPLLVFLVKSFEGSTKKLIMLLAFFCVTQICFIGSGFLVAYSRTIAFVMGIIAADCAVRGKNFRLNVPIMLALWVVGNLIAYYAQAMPTELGMHYGILWYPGLLVIPGMMLILSWIFEFCSRYKALNWVSRLFSLLGEHSLEIYIFNILIYDVLARCLVEIENNWLWLALAIAIGIAAIFYGKLITWLLNRKKTA